MLYRVAILTSTIQEIICIKNKDIYDQIDIPRARGQGLFFSFCKLILIKESNFVILWIVVIFSFE
jgi:hypothetical protein